MTGYRSSMLSQAWKAGATLRKALAQFEPELDAARIAKSESEICNTLTIGKRNFSAIGIEADPIIDAVGKLQLHLTATADAQASRERQLLAALENAELIAIGYATERRAAAKLELVPPFLFQRQFFKFRKSEFSDGEHRFANVRIVSAKALGKAKIGRPTIRDHVFEIAGAIENQIRHLKPGEQAAQAHRYGMQKFPQTFKPNAPTNRAIDRHLKAYWNSK